MIQTEISENQVPAAKYPYLAINSEGLVLLFFDPGEVVVLKSDKPTVEHWPVGDCSRGWDESQFEPLNGKLTLINK